MATSEWLRRWMMSRVPTRGWGDDCPAGLPVPGEQGCPDADCDSIALTTLDPGQRAWITCLMRPGDAAAVKLSALGILPGREVEVIQRFPAFVLAMGYAEIAIDETLARTIRVRRI